MRENVPGVVVTPETLQETPDWRQGSEEAHEARMIRVALVGAVPAAGIETEEKLNILGGCQ